MIKNKESVISYFGYWPEFCDAKIKELNFNSEGTLLISVNYIDSEINKEALINIKFIGITELKMYELRDDNNIDFIEIDDNDEIVVNIEAASGLSGSLKCKEVIVKIKNCK